MAYLDAEHCEEFHRLESTADKLHVVVVHVDTVEKRWLVVTVSIPGAVDTIEADVARVGVHFVAEHLGLGAVVAAFGGYPAAEDALLTS